MSMIEAALALVDSRGGELRYDISSRQMRCDYCSQTYDPYQFDRDRKGAVDGASSDETYQTKVWLCPNCGAQLTCADDTDVTATCAYCGSANIIFSRIKEEKCPETIIPFSVTKDECGKAYMRALRRAFLSPRSLMRKSQIDSFRGIYMPYWEYVAELHDPIYVEYQKGTSRLGDYTETTINQLEIKVDGTFTGIAHDASKQFDDNISECLDPFPVECEQPFTPGYLCGFYAETDDDEVNKEYKDMAARLIVDEISNPDAQRGGKNEKVSIRLSSEKVDRDSIHIPDEKISTKRTLYPVWFMSCRRDKDKLLYAAVNGSTGKVVADFPISIGRFLCMTLLVAAVIFAFLNMVDFMGRPLPTFAITAMLSAYACRMNGKFFAREKILEEEKFSYKGETAGLIAKRMLGVLPAPLFLSLRQVRKSVQMRRPVTKQS